MQQFNHNLFIKIEQSMPEKEPEWQTKSKTIENNNNSKNKKKKEIK